MPSAIPAARVQAYPPRLMDEAEAASFLGIGITMLRSKGPQPKRDPKMIGNRVLYDINDLHRWADRLSGQPLAQEQKKAESQDVERSFLEKRNARG